jgi:CRISPR-associated endoribonuclease Cas6
LLTGTIHKWLGINKEHGKVSLYSFSNLENGRRKKEGLLFENNTQFFFSSYDDDLIKKIIKGAREDPSMFHGLSVSEIIIQEDPDLNDKEEFYIASPILIKLPDGLKTEHILYNDPRAGEFLESRMRTKMREAGLVDDSLKIRFVTNYPKAKCKLITYGKVQNKVSLCPVIISGKHETKRFIWNVGLGNSTGVGFGAIK